MDNKKKEVEIEILLLLFLSLFRISNLINLCLVHLKKATI